MAAGTVVELATVGCGNVGSLVPATGAVETRAVEVGSVEVPPLLVEAQPTATQHMAMTTAGLVNISAIMICAGKDFAKLATRVPDPTRPDPPDGATRPRRGLRARIWGCTNW